MALDAQVPPSCHLDVTLDGWRFDAARSEPLVLLAHGLSRGKKKVAQRSLFPCTGGETLEITVAPTSFKFAKRSSVSVMLFSAEGRFVEELSGPLVADGPSISAVLPWSARKLSLFVSLVGVGIYQGLDLFIKSSVNDPFKTAQRAMSAKEYNAGLKALARLENDGDRPDTMMLKADLLAGSGNLKAAIDLYREVARSSTTCRVSAVLSLARGQHALGLYDEADEGLIAAFGAVPTDPVAAVLLAESADARQDKSLSARRWLAAAAVDHRRATTLKAFHALLKVDRRADAERLAWLSLATGSAGPRIRMGLARLLHSTARYDQVLPLLDEALPTFSNRDLLLVAALRHSLAVQIETLSKQSPGPCETPVTDTPLEGGRSGAGHTNVLARQGPKRGKTPATVTNQEDIVLRRVRAAAKRRNFQAAMHELETIEAPSDRTLKQRLAIYVEQRRYQEVVETFEAGAPEFQLQEGSLGSFIVSSANLRDSDRVRQVLGRLATDFQSPNATNLLLRFYRYFQVCDEPTRELVRERLLTEHIDTSRTRSLVVVAHDLIGDGLLGKAGRIMRRLVLQADSGLERARCDILAGQLEFHLRNYRGQVQKLNDALGRWQLSPVSLADPEKPLAADNLEASAAELVTDGPLVSVIMTAYNRPEAIQSAIESILRQSWRNLELIVVDDASTDNTPQIIAAAAAKDARVKPIYLTVNGGTYVAKNHGLAAARGEFVVCQDSDDWAHPQKVERSVRELRGNRDAIATTVQHLRCSSGRGYERQNGYIHLDSSSLCYRREPIRNALGFYDSVRIGADTEFRFRMERVFGAESITRLNDLLSIVAWDDQTLSGGGEFGIDDQLGIFSPLRTSYRRAYLKWQEDTQSLKLDFPMLARPFAVEDRLLGIGVPVKPSTTQT